MKVPYPFGGVKILFERVFTWGKKKKKRKKDILYNGTKLKYG